VDAIMVEVPAQLQAEIEKYEQKHAENPDGRNFVPLANAYRKAGELQLAERLLRTGLVRYPDYLSAHIVLGRTLADRGAGAEAAAEFRQVLAIDPQNLIALRTLGDLAVEAGRADEAEYWYRELLAVDPMNEEAQRALVEIGPVTSAAPEADNRISGWSGEEDGAMPVEPGEPEWAETQAGRSAAAPEPEVPEYDEAAEADEAGVWQAAAPEAPLRDQHRDDPALTARWQRPAQEPDGGLDNVELASETLAELYARQGFVDQAVEMYRELIRRRGQEPALVRRLAELEERDPDTEVATADDGEISEESSAAPPPWFDALDLDEPVAGAAEEADPEAPTSPWLPAAVTASEEGGDLDFPESFRFGFEGEAAAGVAPESDTVVPAPAAEPAEDEPPVSGPESGKSEHVDRSVTGPSVAEYFAALLAWQPAAQANTHFAPAAGLSRPAAAAAPVPPEADDEPFPWEMPNPAAAPAPARPEPASEAAAEDFVSDPPSAPLHAATTSQDESGALPPARAPEEDDDDLESFQAWLRSLKR
jgi:tetratricopeptide (TPR) repeat protein